MFTLRASFSTLAGAALSTALFLGLARLVSVPFEAPRLVLTHEVVLKKPRVDSPVEIKRTPKPVRKQPAHEPGPPRIGTGEKGDGIAAVPLTRLTIDKGPRAGGIVSGVDTDVIPRVRVNPDYPPSAITRNIEGWVQVQFTVTAIGTVRDAIVVASEPGTTFDDAALRAIERWRYNPRVVNGEAVERVGLQTIVRFELD